MKIQEKLKNMIDKKKSELAKRGGGPNSVADIAAEAEIVVRGPDGKIKSTHKATKTEITL